MEEVYLVDNDNEEQILDIMLPAYKSLSERATRFVAELMRSTGAINEEHGTLGIDYYGVAEWNGKTWLVYDNRCEAKIYLKKE